MRGERELAFFPGVARGSAFPGFDYETEAGAVAAALRFRPQPAQRAGAEASPPPDAKPGCEASGAAAAAAPVQPPPPLSPEPGCEAGGAAAAAAPVQPPPAQRSGTAAEPGPDAKPGCDREAGAAGAAGHPQAPARSQPGRDVGRNTNALDSARAGLGLLTEHALRGSPGAARAPSNAACLAGEALDSNWVVVTRQEAAEATEPGAGAASQGAVLADAACGARHGRAQCAWERCVDYCNGGPVFCPDADPGPAQAHAFRVLAEYADLGSAIAAVRCAVGGGRAVLCGTHPELAPHWLDAACQDNGGPVVDTVCSAVGAQAAGLPEADEGPRVEPGDRGWISRAAGVRAALARDGPARQRLWRMLLAEAGLVGLRELDASSVRSSAG